MLEYNKILDWLIYRTLYGIELRYGINRIRRIHEHNIQINKTNQILGRLTAPFTFRIENLFYYRKER